MLNLSNFSFAGVYSVKRVGSADVHLKHTRMNGRAREMAKKRNRKRRQNVRVMQSDRKREAKEEFIIFLPSLLDG